MILLLLLFLFSVSYTKETALVSTYPFYDLIREVGDGRFRVEVLIPPKADYHHYELSARDILKISRAKVVFVSGIPLGGWERKLEAISEKKVVRLSDGMELLRIGSIGVDPHVWLSPKRMKRIARRVYRGFVGVDPKGERIFRNNLKELIEKLEELDDLYSSTLANCKIRVLPVVHPALGYLAKDYNLEQVYISGGHVHGGLSPKNILKFTKEVEKRGLNFVFTIYGAPSKITELLEREYKIRTYEINVKIIPTEEGTDYFSIMKHNLSVLKKALRCM